MAAGAASAQLYDYWPLLIRIATFREARGGETVAAGEGLRAFLLGN